MPLIQNPALGRKLQRSLRLIELPDAVLAPEIVGVVLLDDLTGPLSDEDRGCAGISGVAPVAAEFAIVTLIRVGAPSAYDLKVTRVHLWSDTTQTIRIAVPTVAITGLVVSGNTSFRDFTLPGRPTSQVGGDTQVLIPAGRELYTIRVLADVTVFVDVDIRIGTIGDPGDLTGLMVAAETANTRLNAGFDWTESAPQG